VEDLVVLVVAQVAVEGLLRVGNLVVKDSGVYILILYSLLVMAVMPLIIYEKQKNNCIRFGVAMQFGTDFVYVSSVIVLINLVLATFNMVPIPPLDGSKILFSLLPYNMNYVREFLERNSLYLMLVFIFFLWKFIYPLVGVEFSLITGFAL
jgi:Zn-dependent protease